MRTPRVAPPQAAAGIADDPCARCAATVASASPRFVIVKILKAPEILSASVPRCVVIRMCVESG